MKIININGIGSVSIEPIKVNFMDTDMAVYLQTKIEDNCLDAAAFPWYLADESGAVLFQGITGISGEEYKNWDGDSEFVFTNVADTIGVTIIQ